VLFCLQNEKTRTALAEAGSLALAEFIKRPQAETQIGATEQLYAMIRGMSKDSSRSFQGNPHDLTDFASSGRGHEFPGFPRRP
jgi:hypothetical protein